MCVHSEADPRTDGGTEEERETLARGYNRIGLSAEYYEGCVPCALETMLKSFPDLAPAAPDPR